MSTVETLELFCWTVWTKSFTFESFVQPTLSLIVHSKNKVLSVSKNNVIVPVHESKKISFHRLVSFG